MTKTTEAPDPNTHIPAFQMPPGACDAHCHVFGPGAEFPYAADRAYTPPDAPKAALAALHAKLGISRAVIVHASCHGTDNRVTVDAIASSNGAWRGVAVVDENFTEADFAALHAGGMRGARFNFVRHLGGAPSPETFRHVLDRMTPLGWHLVLHLDAQDIAEYSALCRGLKIPFVIDHMGRVKSAGGLDQTPFRALLELQKLDHCWVKVCGSERVSSGGPPFADAAPFAAALIAGAPDRVLWGTDWPHPNVGKFMPNDGDLVDLVPHFAPDAATQRRLLVDNPARLYGF